MANTAGRVQSSFSGVGRDISSEFNRAAADVRTDFSRMGADAKEAGREIEKAVSPDAFKKASSGFADGFKGAIAAAGIGLIIANAFGDALNAESLNDKLAAQLGLTEAQSAKFGKTAGDLYANAYGDSLGQVNDALSNVQRNIGDAIGPGDEALKNAAANALNLSQAFDQDLGASTAAVAQLLRTGLVDSADEAFDVITKGLQSGVDKSGDFLETITEYSTQFRKVGLSAEDMTGILTQGLKAGARDADIVADAIKEFSIRAVDGTKLTAEGFAAVGLNAEEMAAKIGAGGPEAAAALDLTLDRLRAIEDPVKRSAAAVALFGTQAEDLGDALFALDPSEAAKGLGDVAGAAEKLGDTLAGNNAAKIEAFKRQALQGLATVVAKFVIPALEAIIPKVVAVVKALVGFGKFLVEHKPILAAFAGVLAGIAVAIIGPLVAAFGLWAAAAASAAVATLLAAAPIILIGAAIGLLVAGIIWAVQNWDIFREAAKAVASFFTDTLLPLLQTVAGFFAATFTASIRIAADAFQWVIDAAGKAFNWVKEHWPLLLAILTGPIGLAVAAIVTHWDTIKNGFTVVKDWIGARVDDVVGFFTGFPGRIASAASGMWDGVVVAFKNAINAIIRMWNNLRIPGVSFPGFDIPGPGPNIPGFTLPGIDFPNIPYLHSGGIFRAGSGGEGLALLRDRERVSPAMGLGNFDLPSGGRGPTIDASGWTVLTRDEPAPDAVRRELTRLSYVLGNG